MSNREAIDVITGYYYQFDKTILELLRQENPDALVYVEGIEDIDIETADETIAIQCKYHAKKEYNHSVIKEPITLMIRHFSENRNSNVKYHLYGHYKSGQEKLPNLTCENLKKNFLTYSKNHKGDNNNKTSVKIYVHADLDLTDDDLKEFLTLLTIDIHAPSIDEQYNDIISEIKNNLNVSHSEADLYHYNSALKVVRNLSIEQDRKKRHITKSRFLNLISEQNDLFDAWFMRRKGREKYIKSIKKQYLTSSLNMEPFNRFFIIKCNLDENLSDLKEVILTISNKWSKLSKRQNPKFCPFICLIGLGPTNLTKLKNSIYSEGIAFSDPYPFKGSNLSTKHFFSRPSIENGVKFKLIDSLEDLNRLIGKSEARVELYQFYRDEIPFNHDENKHIKIKIENLSYIKDLTK